MNKKTSLIHKTVLKKNILRYAPIWAIYTIFLLLALFSMADYETIIVADNVLLTLSAMGDINAIYAGICAAFLFMDLFNRRLCNALHAFPLSRESWLANHILSGFLFSLVPNLLVSLIAIPILMEYSYVIPIWLGCVTLQHIFFFGSAVLCAVCAGNLIGMIGLYGIFHSIVILIGGMAELFYQPLLHGVELKLDNFLQFAPVYQINTFYYVDFQVIYDAINPYGVFHSLNAQAWIYTTMCTAVGVISILLAWLVYRKRPLETAGDLLSLKKLSPLFLLICTVGAGAVLYLLSTSFNGKSVVFLAVGAVVGYFACHMLLNRTVKVFTKRTFLGLGIIVAVMASTMLLTRLDPIGITRYVPELNEIESAAVIGADKAYNFYPLQGPAFSYAHEESNNIRFKITDAQELTELQEFHRQLIKYRPDSSNKTTANIYVRYTLKSGRVISRNYQVEPDSEVGKKAKAYFNDIRYIFGVDDPLLLYDLFETAILEGSTEDRYYTNIKLASRNEISGLLNAIQKDCQAGNMAQNWVFHENIEENFYIFFHIENTALQDAMGKSRINLRVWKDSSYTNTYIRQLLAKRAEK